MSLKLQHLKIKVNCRQNAEVNLNNASWQRQECSELARTYLILLQLNVYYIDILCLHMYVSEYKSAHHPNFSFFLLSVASFILTLI